MTTPKKPTDRQKEILEYIETYTSAKGISPSFREIAGKFRFKSLRSVQEHLRLLEQKGFIRKERRRSRSIVPSYRFKGVPVLGKIAAGVPIVVEQDVLFFLPMDFHRPAADIFALKVKGDSMINAGIMDGDFCLVRRQTYADDGQIVAVVLDDSATVKRFFRKSLEIGQLHAENVEFPDKEIPMQDLRICGIVIGVWRDYEKSN